MDFKKKGGKPVVTSGEITSAGWGPERNNPK